MLARFFTFICLFLLGCSELGNNNNVIPEDQSYIKLKDSNIYYQSFGKGDPIIVLHGGPGLDQQYLMPHLLELAKHHEVIFYDQRGSGGSSQTEISEKNINLNKFTSDIEEIREKLGFKKVTLLGHSWGGFLAMNYASKYPGNINKLILVSSAPINYKGFKEFRKNYEERVKNYEDTIWAIRQSKPFQDREAKTISEFMRLVFSSYFYDYNDLSQLNLKLNPNTAKNLLEIYRIFNKNLFDTDFDISNNLSKIKAPTLIIHGDYDVIPLWTVQEVNKKIPNSELLIFEYCGHFPFIENKENFFAKVEEFLNNN